MRNGKSECSLSIQTQDNLPLSLNELVKCTVISSLVTTQRKLKAMSLLSGRNQLARAVLNPNPMDFCTKDLLTTTSERIVSDGLIRTESQRIACQCPSFAFLSAVYSCCDKDVPLCMHSDVVSCLIVFNTAKYVLCCYSAHLEEKGIVQ